MAAAKSGNTAKKQVNSKSVTTAAPKKTVQKKSASQKPLSQNTKNSTKNNVKNTTTNRKKQTISNSPKTIPVPKPQPKEPVYAFPLLKEILVIAAFGFATILFLSCFQKPDSALSWMQKGIFFLFGNACYFVPFFVFFLMCFIISNYGKRGLGIRSTALCIFFVSFCAILSLLSIDGGKIGNSIAGWLSPVFGLAGTYIVLLVIIIIGIVLFSGKSLLRMLRNNTLKAYEVVREEQKMLKVDHEIHIRERELAREREKSRRMREQYRRMEQLEAEKTREITGRTTLAKVRGIGDVTVEPDENDLIQMGHKTETKKTVKKKEDARAANRQPLTAENTVKPSKESVRECAQESGMSVQTIREDEKPEFLPEIHFGGMNKQEPMQTSDLHVESDADEEFERLEKIYVKPAKELVLDELEDEQEEVRDLSEMERKDEINITETSSSNPYEQVLAPDSVDVWDMKNTYSNTSKHEMEENRTKTVRTASGKVITVELDTLPGEKKQPADVKKREVATKYESSIVPVEYVEPKEYIFPPIELLKKGSTAASSQEELTKRLKSTALKLQQTLQNFGVGVTVTDISCGPSVTRYELQPEMGVKVSKIVSLSDDIKLNLAAEELRIEAPIPGKAAIGIEVPNKEKRSVMLRDILESDEFKKHKSNIVFAAGEDIAGSIILADIAKMPHLLIAGTTGSGKSVCVNSIIMSILYKSRPSDVKMIMIDPKVVELSVYNGIPHLMLPVVTDPKKAAGALNWAVTEMTERYQKFADYRVRDMKGYNEKVEAAIRDGATGDDCPKKMPQLVIIVDELSDLMMAAPGEVEDAICRLAQMARAAGIHLIIATQRPSVNVITGLIKANVPSRIAFSVKSGIDSRTILDMNGAEKLLGKGDMLFYPSGYPKPLRVQGCFVSDDEVQAVVKFLSEQKNVIGGEHNDKIVMDKDTEDGGSHPKEAVDEYFEKAAMLIIDKEKASIGMLQRVFKIGFNRAARIMDQLAEAGVVSEEEGTKPRRVLMTLEEFQNR